MPSVHSNLLSAAGPSLRPGGSESYRRVRLVTPGHSNSEFKSNLLSASLTLRAAVTVPGAAVYVQLRFALSTTRLETVQVFLAGAAESRTRTFLRSVARRNVTSRWPTHAKDFFFCTGKQQHKYRTSGFVAPSDDCDLPRVVPGRLLTVLDPRHGSGVAPTSRRSLRRRSHPAR